MVSSFASDGVMENSTTFSFTTSSKVSCDITLAMAVNSPL